jgi:hypothetical protein
LRLDRLGAHAEVAALIVVVVNFNPVLPCSSEQASLLAPRIVAVAITSILTVGAVFFLAMQLVKPRCWLLSQASWLLMRRHWLLRLVRVGCGRPVHICVCKTHHHSLLPLPVIADNITLGSSSPR